MFQSTIVKKYVSTLTEDELISKWETFKSYFHDSGNQNRIRELKEEQFQEGFLKELFVGIFGYIITPNENYNLIPELKNPKDNRKVDGALVFNNVVKCVIELKGTNTTDLGKVETQAFSYKNNQPGCEYVVTSNFEKLRFYIGDAMDFLEFNLFELSQDEFNLMYLCLSSTNIENDLPQKIKSESLSQEELITKSFYKDYSLFKRELFNNLIELNREFDELTLFKKSQKLLDRLLFLFFGEDKFLLPPNSVRLILDDWKDLIERDVEIPLYDRFKKYFGYLNTGYKGVRYDVFPYNGGLFKPDDVLDNILIDDNLFYNHTKKLSEYDFESEVDVNILGHIFENSLNEIEEISNDLINGELNKTNSKRKKDGVFYTPKYITKYIVDNTIGKLCEKKKLELKINEEDYVTDKKRIKKTIKGLSDKLNEYRNWLLQLSICDPACGSGAFLNQSLDFMIKEHKYVDELQSKLFGDSFVLSDVENSILENNLYGVDINEESVEISKLSLWLRTAQPNRKLNSLSENIKCGNSLVDEPTGDVENYFKWEEEFPKVFEKGGFDVVIGNPPYGASLNNKEWLKTKFKETSFGTIDSYKYFVQLGVQICKDLGVFGYIMPDSYLEKEYFKDLRKFVSNQFNNVYNIKLGDDVFDDVNLPTSIMILQTKGVKDTNYYYLDVSKFKKESKQFKLIDLNSYNLEKPEIEKSFISTNSIIDKTNTYPLIEIYNQVMGVKVYQKGKGIPKQTLYELQNDVFISKIKSEKYSLPFISQGIKRYYYDNKNEFISYGPWLAEPRDISNFNTPKIVVREIINPTIFATYIEYDSIIKNIAGVITQKREDYSLKYLLSLLNSKLFNYYVREQSPKSSNKSYPSFNSRLLKSLPIKKTTSTIQESLAEKVDTIIQLYKNFYEGVKKFNRSITRNLGIEVLPKKIQKWYLITFDEFVKELSKKKVKLSLKDQGKWEDYFINESEKVLEIKNTIEEKDKEINKIVYQLYGLTKEEIEIIESSN